MSLRTTDVTCFFHDPIKAPLLRTAVLPVLRSAVEAGLDAHVERHWLHGPHVRVRVAGAPADVAAATATLTAEMTDFLRHQPSRAALSHAALLAHATAAGRAELVPPPYEPIWPDNTVRVAEVDSPAPPDLLGRSAAEIRAALLRAGIPAIEATLAYLAKGADSTAGRVSAAVMAMTAHAGGYPLGPHNGYLCFRSHLEAFLHRDDSGGHLRARCDAVWRRHSDEITALVAGCAGPIDELPEPAAQWRRWIDSVWWTAAAAHQRGELAFPSIETYQRRAGLFDDPVLVDRWRPPDRHQLSEFHQMLGQRPLTSEAEQRFNTYRFCTNVFYLLLAVCDVTPAERYLAASLVSEAVERLAGQGWRARLAARNGRTAPP